MMNLSWTDLAQVMLLVLAAGLLAAEHWTHLVNVLPLLLPLLICLGMHLFMHGGHGHGHGGHGKS